MMERFRRGADVTATARSSADHLTIDTISAHYTECSGFASNLIP